MCTETSMSHLTMGTDMSSLNSCDSEEKWCAYWSDKHQRAYYHESKSGNVSWIAPDSYSISSSFIENDKERNEILVAESLSSSSTTTMDHQESITSTYDTPARDTNEIWTAKDFIPDTSPHNILSHSISVRKRVARRRSRRKNIIWTVTVTCAVLIGGIVATSCYVYTNNVLPKQLAPLFDYFVSSLSQQQQNDTFYKDDSNKTFSHNKTLCEAPAMTKPTNSNIPFSKTKPIAQEVQISDYSLQTCVINIFDNISKADALHEISYADELKFDNISKADALHESSHAVEIISNNTFKVDASHEIVIPALFLTSTISKVNALQQSCNLDELIFDITSKVDTFHESGDIFKVYTFYESCLADELPTNHLQELATTTPKEDYSPILCCSMHESSMINNILHMEVADTTEQIHRPNRCFIPLSYLFSKECDYVLEQRPLFNARDLVDSMMQ